jgi:hypothetical protein
MSHATDAQLAFFPPLVQSRQMRPRFLEKKADDVGVISALIVGNVPNVRKAVKWNSPFYGIEGQGWFLNFHCFRKYVKVAFFRRTALRPVPPGESKHKEVRYLDIQGRHRHVRRRPADTVRHRPPLTLHKSSFCAAKPSVCWRQPAGEQARRA